MLGVGISSCLRQRRDSENQTWASQMKCITRLRVTRAARNAGPPRNSTSYLVRFAILVACLLGIGSVAHAQLYPEKPVRFVIGLTAGSSTDIIARIIAQELTKLWGQ